MINIGRETPNSLVDYAGELEKALGQEAKNCDASMQDGAVPATRASASRLEGLIGYQPASPFSVTAPAFLAWTRNQDDA